MAPPADIRDPAVGHVVLFCENQTPAEHADKIRVEHACRGNAITIIERRPPWREEYGPEWTTSKIAQLRFDAATGRWSLLWANHSGRWLGYDGVEPAVDVGPLLAEIGEDPYGCFWG